MDKINTFQNTILKLKKSLKQEDDSLSNKELILASDDYSKLNSEELDALDNGGSMIISATHSGEL